MRRKEKNKQEPKTTYDKMISDRQQKSVEQYTQVVCIAVTVAD